MMAGELLASAVVKELLSKLGSGLWSEPGLLLLNFKKELEDMKTTLHSIQAVLDDAQNRSLKEISVCLWLKRLKAAAYDIEDVLDQLHIHNQSKDAKVTLWIVKRLMPATKPCCETSSLQVQIILVITSYRKRSSLILQNNLLRGTKEKRRQSTFLMLSCGYLIGKLNSNICCMTRTIAAVVILLNCRNHI
ncbi:putative disease resistance protein RGA3 [Typha angustifolia]|uniref:putative disease resistance protein RGA3 n=1 Tax=Typha angustifolia TaxID=59011 RepID=UPI003C3094F6